ncbi:MAG: 2-hydroxychromene-2-carboxylate isomerase [Panacagrimonas sp.]
MPDVAERPAPGPVQFYFDFISPFGYFASLRIDAFAAGHGRQTEWHSMLLGISVLKVMGLQPMLEIPLRGAYLKQDAARYMRLHGLHVKRPIDRPPTNPVHAGRAFHWLRRHAPHRAQEAARALFHAYWMEDRALDTPDIAADVASLGDAADRAALLDALTNGEGAALLRQAVDESLAVGVFGSPSFRVDGELFFGVEKMELLGEWLRRGGW